MIIKRNSQKKLNRIQPHLPQQPVEQISQEQIEEQLQDSSSLHEENIQQQSQPEKEEEKTFDIFEGFNFDDINFSQRAERRRGDRRRGYRRIDDRNLISRAQQEAIMIKEQASKEGYEKGVEEAKEDLFALKSALEEFFGYKEVVYDKVAGDILDISLKVAEKIIKKEVETDKKVLDAIVHDALKSLAKDENKIILKVNPTDVEYTKEIVPALLSSGQFEAKIFVTGDKDVDEGSAVIETSNGIIDANISTQLELIKEAFKQI